MHELYFCFKNLSWKHVCGLVFKKSFIVIKVCLLGVTSSLNPNGVGLDTNPALVMGKPKLEFSATQVTVAQSSGQCYTTLTSPKS